MRATHFNYHFGYMLLIGLMLIGCDKVEPLTISNDAFSLDLWTDWKYQRGQGIDSYVGSFTNGDEEIRFDVGYFAFSDVASIQPTPETTYFEETIIDSMPAKILKKNDSDGAVLILYIGNDTLMAPTKLYVRNPVNDERYITIFKSFRSL